MILHKGASKGRNRCQRLVSQSSLPMSDSSFLTFMRVALWPS